MRKKPTALLTCSCFAGLLLTGCASKNPPGIEPQPGQVTQLAAADADAKAEAVRRDPRAYLAHVAERCAELDEYTLEFTRYERRGWFGKMHGPERIAAWFRREPFSVRFLWLDEDVKYKESTFVEGQHDNRVRFVTRWWAPPLAPPPAINRIEPQDSVTWGESKHPVTDFGLERMVERTLTSMKQAGDQVVLTYEGLLQLPQTGDAVHHLHLEYAPSYAKVPIQDLYINVATDLPAGTVLKHESGKIDAAYYYDTLDTDVDLTDADFLLNVEREKAAAPAGDEEG